MNLNNFLSIIAAALLFFSTAASAATRPPASETLAVYNEAVSLYDQHRIDEADPLFRKVIADSYSIDELVEHRVKAAQYLGFIERERHDFEHSNRWFKAATVILKNYGTESMNTRWRKVLANEIQANRTIIDNERGQMEMQLDFKRREVTLLSVLLFLTVLALTTVIVLFSSLRKAYRQLAAKNNDWAGANAPELENPAEKEANTLRDKIIAYVEGSRAYLNPDLSLDDICKAIGSNRTYVSSELNTISTRFNAFINEYRVKEAIRLFSEHPEMEMEDVLERSGFNSRTTFYNAFKEATGMSPGVFRKAIHSASAI